MGPRTAASRAPSDEALPVDVPAGEIRVLEMIARGKPRREVLDELDRRSTELSRARFAELTAIATERADVDQALAASEAEAQRAHRYLTEAQRLSKTGTFTWDVQGDDHTWSEEIHRIFGFDLAASVSMPMIMAAVHPDDMPEVARLIGAAVEGGDFDLVFRILTVAGDLRYAHVVGHRIESIIDRPVFLGALQDVTESTRAVEALHRARRELAEVSRANSLGALTASVAHEVNQPLAAIITNANTCLRLLMTSPPDIEEAKEIAQHTIRDAYRAAEVIKRLRALYTGKPLEKERVDLNEAARDILALALSELQGERIVIHSDFSTALPEVIGDRIQLQQVIMNLVINASQAMQTIDDRPRTLSISTATDDEGNVVLAVCDCGPGAGIDDLETLFAPFYTTKPDGMGVGLSVSRFIIDVHGGRLRAVANDGPGLTFSFAIPAA